MQGKGKLPKRADAITDEEINTLYEKGCLGADTPSSLLNTMWFLNTLHFGIRGGGEEHRSLCWGDLSLKCDTNIKLEYVEYSERQTKTCTGADVRNTRDSRPRMYEMKNDDHCPVKMYKAYKGERPTDYNQEDKPFSLAPVTNKFKPNDNEQWFLRAPVRRNKLNNLMKLMAKEVELPDVETKRIRDTSVCKHLSKTVR